MINEVDQLVIDNFKCNKCQQNKGEMCKLPNGRIKNKPHQERYKSFYLNELSGIQKNLKDFFDVLLI